MYKIPANTLFTGRKLIYVPECHSTNSSLAELNEQVDLPEGTVFITDHQIRGRGQRGNSWESGQGENLTFSILLQPSFLAAMDQFQLNMAVTVGIARGLQNLISSGVSVKWPNDILVDDMKVGGVLIKNQTMGANLSTSIVGIGLNVNQTRIPHAQAGSLIQWVGQPLGLNEVLEVLLVGIESNYLRLRSGAQERIRAEYLALLYKYRVPQLFEAGGNPFMGLITDVDESGRLCVECGGEILKFSLKEIRMVFPRRSDRN